MPTRRTLLGGLAATAGLALGRPRRAWAGTQDPRRLVVVLLRGGMDGLAAVPTPGDPDWAGARGGAADAEGLLDLDGFFALHPALAPVLPLWTAGELSIVHAAGLPSGARSHFDAQDLLETGGAAPGEVRDGWMNRALDALPASQQSAIAIGGGLPLILQGDAPAGSIDPARDPVATDDFLNRVAALYAHDDRLGPALDEALRARDLLSPDGEMGRPRAGGAGPASWADQLQATAALLAQPDGPTLTALSLEGWDTHTAQGRRLGRLLGGLGEGLATFRAALPPERWRQTVVVVVSEFGRTVAANGTGGTDHGSGGVMLVAGGAVAGGQVLGDWPGLATKHLREGRDLASTTDVRTVLGGVLREHLGVAPADLRRSIFPGAPLADARLGLVRG